ncbi:Ctr copper transporter family protein [Paecilomyces variotii No. 5]|uniref:Copper transport protein n=1 Tax=Byssochlamys spectabilis (strain No. 5 / NBRC 109023) TaxID=1356009 RepID=V5FV43_BYSSN|nr:Ctr copper transporter family protein [Paecilomyces variotii No. 5]
MDSMTGMAMSTTSTGMAMGSMTSTASAAMSSSTGMDMGGMSMDTSSDCKVSMLWNWDTIDACFLSKSWHITSHGMFGGSCIGVICLVLVLEFLRRVGREYDAYIVRRTTIQRYHLSAMATATSRQNATTTTTTSCCGAESSADENIPKSSTPPNATSIPPFASAVKTGPIRPTFFEQLVRAVLHMLQFAVAYFIMLLAMYFNGYIIICIFIGAFLGAFLFSWEPLGGNAEGNDATSVTACCG